MKVKPGFLILLVFIFLSGCGKVRLQAKYHLFRAEQIFWKANYFLRDRRVPFEKRKPLFAQACREYIKAFQLDASIFNAAKIEEASQSCSSGDDREAAGNLEEFYASYCQDHPKECEYGFMPSNPEISEF